MTTQQTTPRTFRDLDESAALRAIVEGTATGTVAETSGSVKNRGTSNGGLRRVMT